MNGFPSVKLADEQHIDVHDSLARRYWAREFGVTDTELRFAAKAAGTVAAEVREHLRKKGLIIRML